MPTNFMIRDEFTEIGDQIERQLRNRGIAVTNSGKLLLMLAMQAQADDHELGTNQLRNLVSGIPLDHIADYFKRTYRTDKMDFNRALHLLSDWGVYFKYPWTPTRA